MMKIKAAVSYIEMVTQPWREFEERVEELDHSSLVKGAARYAEETGLQLELDYPNLTFIKHDGG